MNYRQIRWLPRPQRAPPVPASGKLPSRARAPPLPGYPPARRRLAPVASIVVTVVLSAIFLHQPLSRARGGAIALALLGATLLALSTG